MIDWLYRLIGKNNSRKLGSGVVAKYVEDANIRNMVYAGGSTERDAGRIASPPDARPRPVLYSSAALDGGG